MNRCFVFCFVFNFIIWCLNFFFGWDHLVGFRASHFKFCDDDVTINCEDICEIKGPIVLLFFDSRLKRDRFGLLIITL